MSASAVAEQATVRPSSALRIYGIVGSRVGMPVLNDSDGSLAGRSWEPIAFGDVAALAEQVDTDRPVRRRDLLAHNDLLSAVVQQTAVIPLAFGTTLADAQQVIDELLAPQHDRWATMLSELEGRFQFQLRVRYSMDSLLSEIVRSDPRVAALRDYTRGLPAEVGRHQRIQLGELVNQAVALRLDSDAEWLHDHVATHTSGIRVVNKAPSKPSMTLAVLLDQERLHAFEADAERCAERLYGRAELQLLGPHAVFDFLPDG